MSIKEPGIGQCAFSQQSLEGDRCSLNTTVLVIYITIYCSADVLAVINYIIDKKQRTIFFYTSTL
jgi:hypothetical protein